MAVRAHVIVRGRVDHKERGETKLVVQEIEPFDPTPEEIAAAGEPPPDVVAKIGSPAYVTAAMPARTYDGQPTEIPTASIMNLLVTREAINDDLVYLMTKSLFDHLDQLVQTHPAARDIDVAKAPFGLPIPLHPGAARYYREIGLVK